MVPATDTVVTETANTDAPVAEPEVPVAGDAPTGDL